MDDHSRQPDAERDNTSAPGPSENDPMTGSATGEAAKPHPPSNPASDESLVEELAALIDDGRTYAQAEIAFQKTRAKIAGRAVGIAAASLIVAIILLHIAFLALAVGMVMALEPLVTIWGAIAIVVGALILLVAVLVMIAVRNGKLVSAVFSSSDKDRGA